MDTKISHFAIDKNFKIQKVNHQEEKKGKKLKKTTLTSFVNFFNIGYNLVAPLVLGAVLGFLIDKYYQTGPKFTLLLIFLGTVATFYYLWKLINASH
jgi:F0F1-type ATP synthase assembly protein I